jgi:hypothetical protein
MPCACQKNRKPELPADTEWGPLLWTLLHGLAERSGHISNVNQRKDEIIAWTKMMAVLHYGIPCEECKAHYTAYLQSNPFPALSTLPYDTMGAAIREWLWRLHDNVNASKVVGDEPLFDESLYLEEVGVTTTQTVTVDCLHDLYGSVNLHKYFIGYKNIISQYLKTPLISLLKWYQVEKHLVRLVSLY